MGEEKVFATEAALGDSEWEEVQLPFLGQWVRVRRLETPEVVQLTYLPDLLGYGVLMSKLQANPKDPTIDAGALAAENYRYQAHVAHLAVIRDPEAMAPVDCDECGWQHPASLWTVARASRLQPKDLDAITHIALNADLLDGLRPFSPAATPAASSALVESGESTQPTSS